MTRKAIRNPGAPSGAAVPAAPTPATPTPTPTTPTPRFEPVHRRHRHDGWTPARQVAFIEALAECGCVEEACARVGMADSSAYALRRQPDAASFRIAWDLALDHAIQRLADAAFARAIRGVARPVFYKGEQVGERRHYDERLTMFLLRYRDPQRYGNWLDRCEAQREADGAALDLGDALRRIAEPPAAPENGAADGEGDDWPDEWRLAEPEWQPRRPLRFVRVGGAADPRKAPPRRTPEQTDALLTHKLNVLSAHLQAKDAAAAKAAAEAAAAAKRAARKPAAKAAQGPSCRSVS